MWIYSMQVCRHLDFGNGTTFQIVLTDVYALVPEYWKSQQLNLVVDGKEHLRALLCDDVSKVYQATWSRNPYLSNMLHMGCRNQQIVYFIKQIPERVDYRGKAEQLLQQQTKWSSGEIPEVADMRSRFGSK